MSSKRSLMLFPSPTPAGCVTRSSTRIKTLSDAFANIKFDIDTQRLLLHLTTRRGLYCQICSPLNKVGTCGPTCALLRPGGVGHTVLPEDEEWRRDTLRHTLKYKTAVDGLKRNGQHLTTFELKELERLAEEMRRVGMSENEHGVHERKIEILVDFAEIDWEAGKSKHKSKRYSTSSGRSEVPPDL